MSCVNRIFFKSLIMCCQLIVHSEILYTHCKVYETNFVTSPSDKTFNIGFISMTLFMYELHHEKTRLQGFQPGPTHTGLYNHRRWLET